MANDFNALRNKRKESFAKLMTKVQNDDKSYVRDERYWRPTVDAQGTGSAVIRFLPAAEGEEFPYIKYFSHNFKGPTGRFYNHLSLTTRGEKDPVAELNSRLWNSSQDDNSEGRRMARAQKRTLHYVANILVVRDPGDPSNEGKVFLYSFGKTIWDKLSGAMNPKYDDETPFNPFDPWTGANLKLRIKKSDGYRNYDDSSFDAPSQIAPDDASIEAIWNMTYKLQPEIGDDKFETYEELQKSLREVIGNSADAILGLAATSAVGTSVTHSHSGASQGRTAAVELPAVAKTVNEIAAMSIDDSDSPPFDVPAQTKTKPAEAEKSNDQSVDDVMNWLNNLK